MRCFRARGPPRLTPRHAPAQETPRAVRGYIPASGDEALLRILIVSPTTSTNGAGLVRHALALALRRAGHFVALASPREFTALQVTEALAGVEHHFYRINPYHDLDGFLRDERLAPDALDRATPQLILFNSGLSPWLQRPFMATALARGIPYIIVEHLVAESLFPPAAKPVLAPLYAAARAIVLVSEASRTALGQALDLPPGRTRVILNGRPEAFFAPRNEATRAALRAQWNVPREAVVVTTVAKFEPVKGHVLLVEALRRLRQIPAWERLYVTWIGDGPERDAIARRAAAAGVATHVRMLGHRWDVAHLHDGADIFALTSIEEAMPLSLQEAMAKGLVPIATDVGGVAEALGDTGILLPPPGPDPERTVAALVAALQSLVADPARAATLAAAAQARAQALFHEDRMLAEYLALIESVVAARA